MDGVDVKRIGNGVTRLRRAAKSSTADKVPQTDPVLVIFYGPAYQWTVFYEVAFFWLLRGISVDVVDVSVYPLATRAASVKAAIASYAAGGTTYFHLIGDIYDGVNSRLWDSSEYWKSMRETMLRLGLLRDDQGAMDDVIPSFEHPLNAQHLGVALNTAPFILSDQDYADTDGDGVPDVVVARWLMQSGIPADDLVQKMHDHAEGVKWSPRNALSFARDIDSGVGGDGSGLMVHTFALAAEDLIRASDPQVSVDQLRSSWFWGFPPSERYEALSDSMAALVNRNKPDLMTIFLTDDFGNQGVVCPPGLLETVVPLVNASSCYGGANNAIAMDYMMLPYGCLAWTGPTGPSWLSADVAFTYSLIEELYGYPERPMAESWLHAVQRAHAVFADSPEQLLTIKSYRFYGDPLSPFRVVPNIEIETRLRRTGSGEILEMPAHAAVGCPAGDYDEMIVELTGDVLTTVDPGDIRVETTSAGNVVFYETFTSDSAASCGDTSCQTTITVDAYGGCGLDSAAVYVNDLLIGYAQVHVKSPDLDLQGSSYGHVDVIDLGVFALHYPSSVCNCVYEKPHLSCADYGAPDTVVNAADVGLYALHHGHEVAGGGQGPQRSVAASGGAVRLEIVEENPLLGQRKLKGYVRVENVERYRVMFLSFGNENRAFDFVGWHADGSLPARTAGVQVPRNGGREIVLVVFADGDGGEPTASLGYFEVDVAGGTDVELTDEDFALVTGDLLEVGGGKRAFRGTAGALGFEKRFTPASYRDELAQNYPNPFNPHTTIAFSLARKSDVVLRIYDVRGALVRTLVADSREAGNHRVLWDGRDNGGSAVATGVYFYRLQARDFVATRKMVMLR